MTISRALFSKYKYMMGSNYKASVDVWRFTNSSDPNKSESRLEEIADILFDKYFGTGYRWSGDSGTGYSQDIEEPNMLINVKYEYEVYQIIDGNRDLLESGVKKWNQNP